ncbi:MAG: glutaredoxin 3 [Proteobacteria bacterium]|jgi:glutaredoxin 3|nr:glutaredoxin 3 [Pseudomonadota bacterium]NCA28318.1 glutaredoxin 3 [Pseudomonadota bacterium]
MKKILIYSKEICPYCTKAKNLLQRKNLQFQEIKITSDELKQEMIKKSNGRMTVPQIFIDDYHVGGCDDLYALEAEGKLDEILKK